MRQSCILSSPNRYKIATFGFNTQGGTTATKAPGTVDTDWTQQVRIARLSEAAGIEAILPGARWIGYGGETNFQGRSFETFAWAAGMAAVTDRTQVFATFHVPTAHPVRVAKTIATIDHISGGRFGLNIVAGWNASEIEMFAGSQREHDARYEFAGEFFDVVNRMLDEEGFFDHEGEFFTIKGAYSEPKPIQSPRPVYMAAGFSPTGRRFAAEYADISFIPDIGLERVPATIAETKEMAAARGREVHLFSQANIVCADSEKEARDYLHYYVEEMGDFPAAKNLMTSLFANSSAQSAMATGGRPAGDDPKVRGMQSRVIAGHGGHMLIGTPEMVVDGMLKLSEAGFDGSTLSWVDYEAGLVQFREQILPLMIDAGLRVDESTTTAQAE